MPALCLAAQNGEFTASDDTHLAVVEALLAAGANATARSGTGATPLHYAVDGRCADVVAALLATPDATALVNMATNTGETPLHWACAYQLEDIVAALLEAGASVNAVTAPPAQRSVLLMACEGDAHRLAKRLLRAGADPNLVDGAGVSPLLVACEYGNDALVDDLLAAGASVRGLTVGDRTPLVGAVRSFSPQHKLALTLLRAGAQVDNTLYDGMSLLHHAVTRNVAPLLQPLLEAGCRVEVWSERRPFAPPVTPLGTAVAKLTGYGVLMQPPYGFPINVSPTSPAHRIDHDPHPRRCAV